MERLRKLNSNKETNIKIYKIIKNKQIKFTFNRSS